MKRPESLLTRLSDPAPHGRLLSNGRYAVLLTGAGSGYSVWNGRALTVWSADRVEDREGFFVYVRDLERGELWSVGYQPTIEPAERYRATARPGVMAIDRRDAEIETRMEVCVAPDDDVEIRRISFRNTSEIRRRLELTSYLEVALNDPAVHAAHPAFSKLFVETQYAAAEKLLLARRRPRSAAEPVLWMFHGSIGAGPLHIETDRARFLGRGRSLNDPAALASGRALSGSVGSVLDPVLAMRCSIELDAGETREIGFMLGAAESRERCLDVAQRHARPETVQSTFAAAARRARALLRQLHIAAREAVLLEELACAVLYSHPALRGAAAPSGALLGPSAAIPAAATRKPLLLVEAEGAESHRIAADLQRATTYWRSKGLHFPVLVVTDDPGLGGEIGRYGGDAVEVVASAGLSPAQRALLRAQAAAVLAEPVAECVQRRLISATSSRRAGARRMAYSPLSRGTSSQAGTKSAATAAPSSSGEPLLFWNGYGGFTRNGSEYVIRLAPNERPPMPWVNVIANEGFGFLVSESGASCTWSRNSRENRLTPWYNDPISDPHGEALYIRDEKARKFWSPVPGPASSSEPYEVRHGFGYSVWRHTCLELDQEVCMFVPQPGPGPGYAAAAPPDPVKIVRLRVGNTGKHPRRLSVFFHARLVLSGLSPTRSGPLSTDTTTVENTILARNAARRDFPEGVAFVTAVPPQDPEGVWLTTDRAAFTGRNGNLECPVALSRLRTVDGASAVHGGEAAALQVGLALQPGQSIECSFLLGEAADESAAKALIERYRQPESIDRAHREARSFWERTVSSIHVETPSPEIDLMLNGWVLYQNLSCRLWGRTAFYQSGGAFGFRDQLQDAAALVWARPDLTRRQIVLHAAHQFVEGDVLHWWHPPLDQGTRTRFSDDLLWLPYVAAHYVRTTGDRSVLDEQAPYLTSRALNPGEDEAYLLPSVSSETADVYDHCCRALDRSLTRGRHGLPLMGTGDWNDGMNRVGREGRGESVWLGFFLYLVLGEFIPLCEGRGDQTRAARYREYRRNLHEALNEAGWDGAWYRRAYYDDGTPLGAAQSDECKIDALAQAWAVISGAAPPDRAALAMDAVEAHLVSEQSALIRLLTPPFDRTPHDPGYIKGYVPGIRENGGQYTHAALWVVRALAELGRRERAAPLLAMLSPVSHGRSAERVASYQVEPYVIAADVYGEPPHVGRGGWTWYTGSAGWMLRVALESVLGLTLEGGETLRIRPCIPDGWDRFTVKYRMPFEQTTYEIEVRNASGRPAAVRSVMVDGSAGSIDGGAARIPLRHDGTIHRVRIEM